MHNSKSSEVAEELKIRKGLSSNEDHERSAADENNSVNHLPSPRPKVREGYDRALRFETRPTASECHRNRRQVWLMLWDRHEETVSGLVIPSSTEFSSQMPKNFHSTTFKIVQKINLSILRLITFIMPSSGYKQNEVKLQEAKEAYLRVKKSIRKRRRGGKRQKLPAVKQFADSYNVNYRALLQRINGGQSRSTRPRTNERPGRCWWSWARPSRA